MALTVTTTTKYVKITDGHVTTYLSVSSLDRVDSVPNSSNPRVVFNGYDPQFGQSAMFILSMADVDTFNGSNQFTADTIADTIIALL